MRILLFLISLIFVFSPKIASAHFNTQIIEMTPNGFEPENIEVDQNATIIFLNKDTEPHWPASNDHPTHEIYPEFDPKRTINPGQSWPFKPTKVGTFKYHDHLFPHRRGTLIVNPEKNEVSGISNKQKPEKKITFFEKIKNFFKDLFRFFGSSPQNDNKMQPVPLSKFTKLSPDKQFEEIKLIANSKGGEGAWDYVKKTFKGQAGSSGNIHDLAHLAGGLIYEKEGFSGLALCSKEFAFGCYHGFLDKAFQKDLSHLEDAKEACLKLGQTIDGPVASCIHGIGHGVASFYGTSDLKKALSSCRRLEEGSEYCFDGVFMEFVRSAPISFFDKEDPLYPCNALENEFGYAYSFACGRNQPALLMSRFNLGFEQVIDICKSASSNPFKEACFDSLGFSLAATADVNKIISGCEYIGIEEYIVRCIKAAAGELVFQEVPGWEEKYQEICNAYPVGQRECLAYVERLIFEYGRQRKINFAPLNPNEDVNSYVRKVLGVCYQNGGRNDCYKQVAQVLYNQFGLAKTVGLLRDNEDYPEVYARCHEVTHYLSRSEYEKEKSIAKVYSQCDSTCHGGCYHGTLEAYLKEQSEQKDFNLANHFPKICGNKEDYRKPIEFNECLHGLGHAAMFVKDMELKQSLALCDTLLEEEHKGRCYSGVFMENSSSSTSFDHASIYIKKDDPFYPCNILEKKYQSLCWQYQSSYFSIITGQDWRKVADLCLQTPKDYQDNCFKTIGTNQVGFTSSLDLMKKDCEVMPTEHFQDVCVLGVVSSLAYRFVGDTKKMIDFCSMINPDFKETCFKQMGAGVHDWDSDKGKVASYCSQIPFKQGYAWCMSAI